MNTRSFLLSSLIAGIVIGLLGNLPLLNFVNCLLCLWVWVGGFFAVYVYGRYERGRPSLTLAQGAGLGALSGLIGALFGTLVLLGTSSLTLPLMQGLARALQIEGDALLGSGGFGETLTVALILLGLDIVLYPLFGALGGVIGVSVLTAKPDAGGAGGTPA